MKTVAQLIHEAVNLLEAAHPYGSTFWFNPQTQGFLTRVWINSQHDREWDMDDIRRWMTLCEMTVTDITEVAPPGRKAEQFIKKHKKEFHKRYGDKADDYLYGTAWKKFGKRKKHESVSIRDYLTA